MKVMLINLDVGSGVEYVGNIFLSWLNHYASVNDGVEIVEYKKQTSITVFTKDIREISPDVVVVNEFYPRVIDPLFYYKVYNPDVRIFAAFHSWQALMKSSYRRPHEWQLIEEFCRRACDMVVTLSRRPGGNVPTRPDVDVARQLFMPVDPSVYRPTVDWKKREYTFGYIGGIMPNKFSHEFVVKVMGSGLKIHCHGQFCSERTVADKNCDQVYESDFMESVRSDNLVKHQAIPQTEVPAMLNRFKYFVMPHNGSEIFCITLLQAIMCGTIPIVVNDDRSKDYDPRWIDWADGLYFGCNDVDSAIKAMRRIVCEEPNASEISSLISATARKRYDPSPIRDLLYDFLRRRTHANHSNP